MNNIPTHILIGDANETEETLTEEEYDDIYDIDKILAIDFELERRYQSVKAELETYEEFMSLPPHQLL